MPGWYQDGKFGIFIHWGAYSVPAFANEWYPRNMYVAGSREYLHHREIYGDQATFGYKDLIDRFTAEFFDAEEWAGLFRRAGAQFIVPVAEHHDGFAMYDSARTDWTAAKRGPKRDIIGQLAEAVRAQWLVFGASSHRAEHWWFLNGGMSFESDVRSPAWAGLYGPAQPESMPPNEEFLADWLLRTCEIVDRYQPQLVWFDWWIEQPAFEPYLRAFAAYYYNRGAQWGRQVAINYKNAAFRDGTAVFDVERGQLGGIAERFWQADTAVARNSWGYVEDLEYKDPVEIIEGLVDVVSKNGALLLNVGPTADGRIPYEDRRILEAIGDWLRVNGEAIYGTRPWRRYGEGPTVVGKEVSRTRGARRSAPRTCGTDRGKVLYAALLAPPDDGTVRLRALGTEAGGMQEAVRAVTVLGLAGEVQWKRNSDALEVTLPPGIRDGLPRGPVTFRVEQES